MVSVSASLPCAMSCAMAVLVNILPIDPTLNRVAGVIGSRFWRSAWP